MKHTKTDPVCIYYKETGPFRRYLNERARGKACLVCVPKFRASNLRPYIEQIETDNHWLIFRDERGLGCQGCDWTGKLDDFWKVHGTRRHDDNIPF